MPRLKSGAYGAVLDEVPAARAEIFARPAHPIHHSRADPRCFLSQVRLRSDRCENSDADAIPEFDHRTEYLGEPGDAHLPRNCSRHRQSRLHYHRNRQTAGTRSTESPGRGATVGVADASRVVVLYLLADDADCALVPPFWQTWSAKDIVLLSAGLFLIAKGTRDIHERLENAERRVTKATHRRVWGAAFQIMFLDILFSFDSVVTAVGMAQQLAVMVAAIVLAMLLMLAASGAIARFVNQHPTIKMLAFAFLILIGVLLVAEGLGQHVDKAYIYFAMAFSTLVEMLKLRAGRRTEGEK